MAIRWHETQTLATTEIRKRLRRGFDRAGHTQCSDRRTATMIEYLKTWLELKTENRAR